MPDEDKNKASGSTDGQTGGEGGTGAEGNTQPAAMVFEDWFPKQPKPVQELVTVRMAKLDATNKAVREERDTFQKELDKLAALFGRDPEKAKQEFEKMSADYKAAQTRIEFLEEATRPEMECKNPAAAWLVAQGKALFNSKGVPDWKAIRAEAPELFGRVVTRTNGGRRPEGGPPEKIDMNDTLRENFRAARR